MSDLERITARRSELAAFAEELAKRRQEVEAEREELRIAERVGPAPPGRTGSGRYGGR